MAVTPASIIAKFPEFASIPTGTIQGFIDDAAFFFDPGIWNVFTQGGQSWSDLGVSYWVASFLFNNVVRGANGENMFNAAPTNTKTADRLSVGFAVNAVNADDPDAMFMANKYGQMYLAIRKSVVQGATSTAPAQLDLSPLWAAANIYA
jgi:hypothetical protein